MKRAVWMLGVGLTAAMVLNGPEASGRQSAGSGTNDVDSVADGQAAASVLRLSAKRGSPAFQWVEFHSRGARLADRVDITVEYRVAEGEGLDLSIEDALMSFDATSAKSIIVPGAPEPNGPGYEPGQDTTTHLLCTQVINNHVPQTANVEYIWEWRNTVDSNGDGTLDSDPEWTLVSFRVTHLYVDATICQ